MASPDTGLRIVAYQANRFFTGSKGGEKAAANLHKHKASFAEAASVFLDPLALTFSDPDHSDEEDREITIASSSKQRVLFVSHCERGDRIRIISARSATRKERLQYEQRIGKEAR